MIRLRGKYYEYVWVGLFFLLAACRPAAPSMPITATATRASAEAIATPSPTAGGTLTAEPLPTSQAIDNLTDVENAIIRIETKGNFYTPRGIHINVSAGYGSGFIIDPSGLALTLSHIVTGSEEISVWVGTNAPRAVPAEILAISECLDLALIDLEGDGYDYLAWSQRPLENGQKIYLEGFNLEGKRVEQMSSSLLSLVLEGLKDRLAANALLEYQVNAPEEFFGGPILLPDGSLIGVNAGQDEASANHYGLDREQVLAVLQRLIAGDNDRSLGINGLAVKDEEGFAGIWVTGVEAGSLADRAGIRGGDWLVGLAGQVLALDGTMGAYCQVLSQHDLSQPLDVQVVRGYGEVFLEGQINGSPLAVIPTATPRSSLESSVDLSQSGKVLLEERFDRALDKKVWNYFLTNGIADQVFQDLENGSLTFEINMIYTYPYYIYRELNVSDAWLSISADNKGFNNNNVTLVCRQSEKGWYEFNVASNGYYYVKRYNPSLPDIEKYATIGNGGSFSINMGQKLNTYGFRCLGDALTVFINGKEIRTFQDAALTYGKVGFGIGSYNVTPVKLILDNFVVTAP